MGTVYCELYFECVRTVTAVFRSCISHPSYASHASHLAAGARRTIQVIQDHWKPLLAIFRVYTAAAHAVEPAQGTMALHEWLTFLSDGGFLATTGRTPSPGTLCEADAKRIFVWSRPLSINCSSAPSDLRANCMTFCDWLEALARVADLLISVYALPPARPQSPASAAATPARTAPIGPRGTGDPRDALEAYAGYIAALGEQKRRDESGVRSLPGESRRVRGGSHAVGSVKRLPALLTPLDVALRLHITRVIKVLRTIVVAASSKDSLAAAANAGASSS